MSTVRRVTTPATTTRVSSSGFTTKDIAAIKKAISKNPDDRLGTAVKPSTLKGAAAAEYKAAKRGSWSATVTVTTQTLAGRKVLVLEESGRDGGRIFVFSPTTGAALAKGAWSYGSAAGGLQTGIIWK